MIIVRYNFNTAHSCCMSFRKKVHKQPFAQRKWLKNHGKSNRLQFSDKMIERLKQYFLSLDQDGSQTISSTELEDPLILFGLCNNRKDVDELFGFIDFDGSGELEFKEFLEVFRRVQSEAREVKMCQRKKSPEQHKKFQDFTKTLLGMENKLQNNISFRLGMSIYRRKNMINALMSKNPREKEEGKSILSKFQEQVRGNPSMSQKLKTQKSANHQCLPALAPRRPITLHRRIRTTFE